jgi:soluble calcium-activated nucleotidase 1
MQPLEKYRGFSSFKFIPGTKDSLIVATKSEENKGKIETCILYIDKGRRPESQS